MAWLSGWQYRVPITITETSGSNLTDFQVKVVVDTASLITAGKMNVDGSDIRFTDSDETSLLSYWIEDDTINTSNTVLWVKIPSIPANGSTTIYMYYGNPSATIQFTITETSGTTLYDYQVKIPYLVDSTKKYVVRRVGINETLPWWFDGEYLWTKLPQLDANSSVDIEIIKDPVNGTAEDPDGVFIFFDDFSSATLDTNKWTVGENTGLIEIIDGKLHVKATSNQTVWLYSSASFSAGVIAETKVHYSSISTGARGGFGLQTDTNTGTPSWQNYDGYVYGTNYPDNWKFVGFFYIDTRNAQSAYKRNGFYTIGGPNSINTMNYYNFPSTETKVSLIYDNSYSEAIVGGASVGTATSTVPTENLYFWIGGTVYNGFSATEEMYFDYVFIRKRAASEPSVSEKYQYTSDIMSVADSSVSGLVLYAPMKEGSGSVTADVTGNGNDGTLSSGVLWNSGYQDYGVEFPDSNNKKVTFGTVPDIANTSMTLLVWIYKKASNSAWNIISSKWFTETGAGSTQDWHFDMTSSGGLRLYMNGSYKGIGGSVPYNTWTQVGFTFDKGSGSVKIYQNASVVLSTSGSRPASSNSTAMLGDSRNGYGMIGLLDEFMLFNRALGDAEISQLNSSKYLFSTFYPFTVFTRKKVSSEPTAVLGTEEVDIRDVYFKYPVYKVPGIPKRYALLEATYSGDVQFFLSPDNSTWEEIVPGELKTLNTSSDIWYLKLTLNSSSGSVSYLKIRFE